MQSGGKDATNLGCTSRANSILSNRPAMQQVIQNANRSVKGKRTYIVSIGFVVIAIVGWSIGAIDTPQAMEWILQGAGFSGLRSAVKEFTL